MSVERVVRKDGSVVWRVRWRQAGRNRSKVVGRMRDADAFDAEIIRRNGTGELARLDAGRRAAGHVLSDVFRCVVPPRAEHAPRPADARNPRVRLC